MSTTAPATHTLIVNEIAAIAERTFPVGSAQHRSSLPLRSPSTEQSVRAEALLAALRSDLKDRTSVHSSLEEAQASLRRRFFITQTALPALEALRLRTLEAAVTSCCNAEMADDELASSASDAADALASILALVRLLTKLDLTPADRAHTLLAVRSAFLRVAMSVANPAAHIARLEECLSSWGAPHAA